MTSKPKRATKAVKSRRRPLNRPPPPLRSIIVKLPDTRTWENASAKERGAIKGAMERLDARQRRVQIAASQDERGAFKTGAHSGGVSDCVPGQLGDAFGTTSQAFVDQSLGNLLTVFGKGTDASATRDINAALAVIDGMKPENEVEAMLITQMIATNETAMRCIAMVGKPDYGNSTEVFGNLAAKMLRIFAVQTEALAKLRRKGEQTVKVVHVHQGGQAVIADTIHQGGRLPDNVTDQSYGPNPADVASPALLGHDASWNPVSVSCDPRQEALPVARWDEPRRAQGQP